MTPPFRPFLLLEKESEQVIPSAQFSGLWLWVRNHFWSLTKLFCRWHYRALNCSVLLWIQSYFPRFSVSDLFAPSYRCCFVAVPQVALSLHSHDDSSYFYSRVFVIVFKSPTSSCFASVAGPFRCELFCHCTAIPDYYCCWSPRSELLFCWVDCYTPILFIWAVGCK